MRVPCQKGRREGEREKEERRRGERERGREGERRKKERERGKKGNEGGGGVRVLKNGGCEEKSEDQG